jgi:predicted DCC family thiol-disulfide oxidoreductase YuxK
MPMTKTPDILNIIKTQDLIVFDGTCMLCNGFMRFILRFDRKNHFKFLTAQSEMGQALYKHYGLNPTDFETFLVFIDDQLIESLDGILAIHTHLGWPWKIAGFAYILPRPAKNWLYNLVARNRYKIFGRRSDCMIPTPDIKARFLD